MALVRITSPHARGNNRTQTIMLWVLGATLPGVAVMTWLFGIGTLVNIVLGERIRAAYRGADPQVAQASGGLLSE